MNIWIFYHHHLQNLEAGLMLMTVWVIILNEKSPQMSRQKLCKTNSLYLWEMWRIYIYAWYARNVWHHFTRKLPLTPHVTTNVDVIPFSEFSLFTIFFALWKPVKIKLINLKGKQYLIIFCHHKKSSLKRLKITNKMKIRKSK